MYKKTRETKRILIETPHFIGKTNVCGRGIKERRVFLRGLTEVDRSDRIDIICQFNAKKMTGV